LVIAELGATIRDCRGIRWIGVMCKVGIRDYLVRVTVGEIGTLRRKEGERREKEEMRKTAEKEKRK
jgi:hypothetical protein